MARQLKESESLHKRMGKLSSQIDHSKAVVDDALGMLNLSMQIVTENIQKVINLQNRIFGEFMHIGIIIFYSGVFLFTWFLTSFQSTIAARFPSL